MGSEIRVQYERDWKPQNKYEYRETGFIKGGKKTGEKGGGKDQNLNIEDEQEVKNRVYNESELSKDPVF